ncbi:MAG TPA: 6-phosphogluconolactonase [Trueperaceae bacterium]|nr:6-phosphogluconolactonase [Trueperaceae bacterium]
MKRDPRFEVVADVTAAATEAISACVVEAVRSRGRAVLCLSGGSTPLPVYRRLAERTELPWEHVLFAWGDERWVPHDHPDSNFNAAREALLDHLPVPGEQVLAWPYGDDPDAAARAYAAALAARLGTPAAGQALFDLNLLGLGADAHTASLFPGTGAALRSEVAFATQVPGVGWRLTLSAPTLSSSRTVLFLVAGEGKRAALAATWPTAWHELGVATDGAAAPAAAATRPAAASVDSYPARAVTAIDDLVVVTDQRH